ncbi:MAG: hypothetical protein H6R01_818 [Burkholderiaceae bacterium]|nr:hypothetical protein [Burkholderiaceae bacterium]
MSISVDTAVSSQKAETGASVQATARNSAKVQLNASIMQASLEVSISSKNEPLTLLYRSAIDRLNEVLKPELGENAIQNAATSEDNSAEGTANSIVSLSTGFYEAYKAQHPGEDGATVLQNFMDTIRSGFEKGYKEAVDILTGLQVFEGGIAADIGKTYDLVLQGYADFQQAQTDLLTKSGQATQSDTETA